MRLDAAIKTLLNEKPFYAHFIMNSNVLWDAYGVPTAGAAIVNATPLLVFNSEFVKKLNSAEFAGVLEHEVEHLVHDHMEQAKSLNKHVHNIASDWSINQRIKVLPDGCITHEFMEKRLNQVVEREQDSMFYYYLLMKNQDKIKDLMPLDDHELKELADKMESSALAKAAVKNAVSKALKGAAGNVPDHLKGIIADLMSPEQISWQQVLRNFVSTSTTALNQGTRKKLHRRFSLDAPGKKKKRLLTLGICTDSSGSVSDELYSQFLNEIYHITKHVGTSYLIEVDCEVKSVEKLKKNHKLTERTGYGGTAYNPGLNKCKELKCDAIIYMGDGDCADLPQNPQIPVLWILPNGATCPATFGKVLTLN